jgi:hypothetical protein
MYHVLGGYWGRQFRYREAKNISEYFTALFRPMLENLRNETFSNYRYCSFFSADIWIKKRSAKLLEGNRKKKLTPM